MAFLKVLNVFKVLNALKVLKVLKVFKDLKVLIFAPFNSLTPHPHSVIANSKPK